MFLQAFAEALDLEVVVVVPASSWDVVVVAVVSHAVAPFDWASQIGHKARVRAPAPALQVRLGDLEGARPEDLEAQEDLVCRHQAGYHSCSIAATPTVSSPTLGG